jgi:hypothetical protein
LDDFGTSVGAVIEWEKGSHTVSPLGNLQPAVSENLAVTSGTVSDDDQGIILLKAQARQLVRIAESLERLEKLWSSS